MPSTKPRNSQTKTERLKVTEKDLSQNGVIYYYTKQDVPPLTECRTSAWVPCPRKLHVDS